MRESDELTIAEGRRLPDAWKYMINGRHLLEHGIKSFWLKRPCQEKWKPCFCIFRVLHDPIRGSPMGEEITSYIDAWRVFIYEWGTTVNDHCLGLT